LRWFTTFLFGATWVVGYSVVALLAYISSTWREMMVWGAGSTLIFTLWCWRFVPETLHFLVSRRRAKSINEWLSDSDFTPSHLSDISTLLQHPGDSHTSEKSSFFHELRMHKIFIVYCLIQLYLWTCDNFIYFGLSLYSTQLAGNRYANYLLMGFVELPAYILAPMSLEKCGRRLVVSGTHLLAAVCFIIPVFSRDDSWLSLTCWLVGKFAISCSFMSLFVYASEVFPTPIRNVSVGLCSVLSRGGAIAAPYIRLLGAISPTSPMFLLASISFLASVVTCLLPETHRKPLPASIRQTTHDFPDLPATRSH
uniref:MFS domain-containing protein n=1 Tax=Heligmosomoides polygyrus TaxID=6339 RepID=A0A183F3B9_HELPZ